MAIYAKLANWLSTKEQPRDVNDYFEEDGAPKKCPHCDSTQITEKVIAVVDVYQGMGPTSEAEYYCECGECVGLWAYGSWHPAEKTKFIENNLCQKKRNKLDGEVWTRFQK